MHLMNFAENGFHGANPGARAIEHKFDLEQIFPDTCNLQPAVNQRAQDRVLS